MHYMSTWKWSKTCVQCTHPFADDASWPRAAEQLYVLECGVLRYGINGLLGCATSLSLLSVLVNLIQSSEVVQVLFVQSQRLHAHFVRRQFISMVCCDVSAEMLVRRVELFLKLLLFLLFLVVEDCWRSRFLLVCNYSKSFAKDHANGLRATLEKVL